MTMQDIAGSSTDFTVAYDGEALSEHRMDTHELGTALLALGELFDRANLLLNGEGTSIELEVQATPAGSFEIELYLAQVYHIAAPLLTSGMIISAAALKNLVVGGDGLITLIKQLGGKRPLSASDEDSNGRVTLEVEGLNTENMSVDYLYLDAPGEVWHLFQDKIITDTAAAVVSPLLRNGIDRVAFREGDQELTSVTEDEVSYFHLNPDNSDIDEIIIPEQKLVVVSPYLGTGSNKWRLNDSVNTYWYSMRDQEFREEVISGSRKFGAEDILICEVRIISVVKGDKIQREFEITKVFAHQSQGYQPPLL